VLFDPDSGETRAMRTKEDAHDYRYFPDPDLPPLAIGTISHNAGRQVFDALWAGEAASVDALIEAKGLKQLSDAGALQKMIDEVIAANPRSVEEFRAGKDKAFNALVGQVMKASRGKANPTQVGELLRRSLG
jgi:aspartyl-tRNA(Asn)/glutamyl-tRNA(Gln) amidotransferase subunit B